MTHSELNDDQLLAGLRINLEWARDEALLSRFMKEQRQFCLKRCRDYISAAMADIEALTQDKNDSGRLSEVPDDEQERFHRAVTEGSARLEEGAAYGKDGL